MLTLTDIFINKWCEIHKYVALVSSGAMIGSLVRSLTTELHNFSSEYSKF